MTHKTDSRMFGIAAGLALMAIDASGAVLPGVTVVATSPSMIGVQT